MSVANSLPQLPTEILSQIFLQVDPHTLYTSIRCLSRGWKDEVECNLLKKEFTSGRWRVGLRVNRKPKVGKAWRGGVAGGEGDQAPGAAWDRILKQVDLEHADSSEEERTELRHHAQREFNTSLLGREGILEDEMMHTMITQAAGPSTHVLPLQFDHYDSETAMLGFNSGSNDWYALFEGAEEGSSSRLDLDFSFVWRFPGDGQSDDEMDGWGVPDQENGWLSRFFCSSFDVHSDNMQQSESMKLHSTPLARRMRKRVQPECKEVDIVATAGHLDWSDEGHEYMSLSLSLGTEFFVRRSAQANFLMRRLEAAAQADDERRRLGKGKAPRRIMASRATSVATTPRRGTPLNDTRSRVDPFNRLQNDATASLTGSHTPLFRSATYASVASTPTSGASSPRGGLFTSRKEPRIAKLSFASSHSHAPHPSANVSGYTSVFHRPKIDEKEAERSDEDGGREEANSDSSLSCSRADLSGCNGSAQSCPRAFFSAQLLTAKMNSNDSLSWELEDAKLPHRICPVDSSTPLSTWQWSR